MKRILLLLIAFGITACDTEGEVVRGRTLSSIAPNSGAAGGNFPVVSGVYYDSAEGLSISTAGVEGDVLVLDADLKPKWVATDTVFPFTGGPALRGTLTSRKNFFTDESALSTVDHQEIQRIIFELDLKNQALETKIKDLEDKVDRLTGL